MYISCFTKYTLAANNECYSATLWPTIVNFVFLPFGTALYHIAEYCKKANDEKSSKKLAKDKTILG